MLVWVQEGRCGGMEQLAICGTAVCRVLLPAEGIFRSYRRNRIWKQLRRRGIAAAAIPQRLEREALDRGIRPFNVAMLRRALLPQLYEKCAIVATDAVTLRAADATPEVYRAAAFLAEKARYMHLELTHHGEQLRDWLRREYGVSIGAAGRRVCGGVTFYGVPHCAEVCLGADCREYQEVFYEVNGQIVPEELLSGLWQTGAIAAEGIRVLSVRCALDTAEQNPYNTMA